MDRTWKAVLWTLAILGVGKLLGIGTESTLALIPNSEGLRETLASLGDWWLPSAGIASLFVLAVIGMHRRGYIDSGLRALSGATSMTLYRDRVLEAGKAALEWGVPQETIDRITAAYLYRLPGSKKWGPVKLGELPLEPGDDLACEVQESILRDHYTGQPDRTLLLTRVWDIHRASGEYLVRHMGATQLVGLQFSVVALELGRSLDHREQLRIRCIVRAVEAAWDYWVAMTSVADVADSSYLEDARSHFQGCMEDLDAIPGATPTRDELMDFVLDL